MEFEDDIFYVMMGNFSTETIIATLGSSSVWEIDMRSFSILGVGVRNLYTVREPSSSKGLTILSKVDNTILVVDSGGNVGKVNVKSGAYSMAITYPTMLPILNATLQLGVNGLKIYDGHLYCTQTATKGLFAACQSPH